MAIFRQVSLFWSQYGNVNAMVLPISSGCISTSLVMPATNNSNSGVIQTVTMYKDTCYDLCYCIESPNTGGNTKVTVAAITSSVTQAQLLSGSFTASQAQILDSYVITTQFPAYQRCPGSFKATGNFTGFVIINETFGVLGSDIRVDNVCLESRLPCAANPCDSTQAAYSYSTAPGLITQFTDLSTSGLSFPISSWSWDFGDPSTGANNTSTLQNPIHVFSSSGWFYVCLYIAAGQASTGYCYDTLCMDIYIAPTDPCDSLQAAFTYSASGTTVTFTDLSSSATSLPILGWSWDFGDPPSGANNSSSLQNPVHVFSNPGWHLVCLYISAGVPGTVPCYDTICMDVYVPTSSPCDSVVAYFTYTSTGLNGNFTDQSLLPAGASISGWSWNFGDPASGANNTSTLQNPVHTFSAPGFYFVCLYISVVTSDGLNCYDTLCKDVWIQGSASNPCDSLMAWFTASGNLTVTFNDLSTAGGGLVVSGWNWNFGDPASGANNVSTLQNPIHIYTAPGIYLVCLIVDAYLPGTTIKCSDTICRDVLASQVITSQRNSSENHVIIAPNPNTGNFEILGNSLLINRIQVFDSKGQKVVDQTSNDSRVSLPYYCKTGIYYLIIETSKGIIKKHISVTRES